MRNVRLVVSYDGTNFYGWQIQIKERTLQGVLEGALSVILAGPVRVNASGRTDAGVHALGQVVSFRTNKEIGCGALKRGLNSLLPPDVRIHDVSDVDDDFDPRRSAFSRRYRYLISTGDVPLPFSRNYAWHMREGLSVSDMSRAGEVLIGTHDFSSFVGKGEVGGNNVREVTTLNVKETKNGIIEIEIVANAFLRHMVRNIVGTLADVGRGRTSCEEFSLIFLSRDRSRAGITAPPQGLYLMEVIYPET